MTTFDYMGARAYTSRHGLVIGGMWIASFAFFIMGLSHPLAGNLCLLAGIMSVVTAGWYIRRWRAASPLSFMQAVWMSLQFYVYASLLMAAAQYVYFRYMDNGMLADTVEQAMNIPGYREMLAAMLPGEDVDTVTAQAVENFRSSSPINTTVSLLFNNLVLGVFLTLPTLLIGLTGKAGKKSQNQ